MSEANATSSAPVENVSSTSEGQTSQSDSATAVLADKSTPQSNQNNVKKEPQLDPSSTAIPRKSLAEKLQDIKSKRAEKAKDEAVRAAKEEGKKEAAQEAKKKEAVQEKAKAKEEAAVEAEAKKYEPNYKFKVKDKEMEFDDFAKRAIKDSESEKRMREIYEKAHGLEFSKQRETELSTKLQQKDQEFQPLVSKISQANEAFKRGDMDEVFNIMNIPQEKVLQWLMTKAQYEQMDPSQRAMFDKAKQTEVQAREAARQTAELQRQSHEGAAKANLREFEILSQIPSIKDYSEGFDAARKAGAFREAIADRGELAALRGKNITVEAAIKEVMELYGPQGASPTGTKSQDASSKGETNAGTVKREPPVIPNVGGRTESPVKQISKVRSTADLKKILSERIAQGAS